MRPHCSRCPVAPDRPCLGETPRFAAFCAWADAGDPVKLAHIVSRSAIAETGPPGGGSPTFPSLATQAGNLAGAVGRFVASGLETTTSEERSRRMSICEGCAFFVGKRCQKCGCNLTYKISMASEHCPIEKW